ncbi:exodeoxyribonuclease VII large subunit [Colwellia sp. MEBiC06753]
MTTKQHILNVSELNKKVRFLLESEINVVWLCGEISNFIAASSGHWYLSLKDEKSQVKCAMFKGNNRIVRIKPANGKQVLVKARVSLYEPRGDFQLIIEQMEDAGDGLLRQQYEALKAKFEQEGLFSLAKKQTLKPSYSKVGIVTSPTGAAIKDIISVLNRRNPTVEMILYPALVQGELAASDIASSIELANARNEVDILIVGRGGGSLEDLWCFNDERVVRAIAASTLPVISAVGHEIDTTLADYVADLRAPTPSAAAEIISSDQSELQRQVTKQSERLYSLFNQRHKQLTTELSYLTTRLAQCDPQKRLQASAQQADELHLRLVKAMTKLLAIKQHQPTLLSKMLWHLTPEHTIASHSKQLSQLDGRLKHNALDMLTGKQQQLGHMAEQLNIVSPLATIARGYSIVRDNNRNIIKSTKQVAIDQALTLQLADGEITANVSDIKNN